MILGRVVGEVWATRKHPLLEGRKLLVVQPHVWYDPPHEATRSLVAVDTVHAGPGDEVVVCLGDGARRSLGAHNLPVEAAILGIVDRVDLAPASVPGARGRRPLTFVGATPSWADDSGAAKGGAK